jgi:hypothetical protein
MAAIAGVLDPKGFGVLDDLLGRREAAGRHLLFRGGRGGAYGFHFRGVTVCSLPSSELTQPAVVRRHGYGSRYGSPRPSVTNSVTSSLSGAASAIGRHSYLSANTPIDAAMNSILPWGQYHSNRGAIQASWGYPPTCMRVLLAGESPANRKRSPFSPLRQLWSESVVKFPRCRSFLAHEVNITDAPPKLTSMGYKPRS